MRRLRKGIAGNITQSIENVTDIAKEVVIDKDAQIRIDGELQKIRMELLHSGRGSSITKFTICGLVTLVVGILSWTFLFKPENMVHAIAFSTSATPVIVILMGIYGTKGGKTLVDGVKRRVRRKTE